MSSRRTSPSSAAPASTRSSTTPRTPVVETPYGAPSAPVSVGDGRRAPGGVPAAARRATTSSRRTASTTAPTSGRCARSASARCWRRARSAACAPRSPPATSSSPTSSSTGRRAGIADLRRARARCTCPSPTPTARACPPRWPRRDGVRAGGTMVVIEGPRFSTRAESQDYAAQGWTLVNMTGAPRGGARPGAAAVLRRDRAGHRHGRRRRDRRGRRPGGGLRAVRGEPRAAQRAARRRRSPTCPTPTAAPARPGPTAST